MKTFSFKSLLTALCMLFSLNVSAYYDFYVDGIYYEIISSRYMQCGVTADPNVISSYSGDMVIPEHVTYNDVTYTVTEICASAFSNFSKITSITIPNTVTFIGNNAFANTNLTSIEIPNSVKTIGGGVFYNCKKLTKINLPSFLKEIDVSTFSDCTSLEEIIIPKSVKEISRAAFSNCSKLSTITIPDSVSSIGELVFDGCNNLTTIYSLNPTPPRCKNNVFTTFMTRHYTDATLYVPKGSLSAYKNAREWKNFLDIQEIDKTGISQVERIDNPSVHTEKGYIIVKNASGRITVYDTSGVMINNVRANGQTMIAVPQNNVYIVKAGSKTVKVKVE